MIKESVIVAHVLPDTGPHLNQSISKLIVRTFPNAPIYLREEYQMFNTTKGFSENVNWINELPSGVYGGQLAARKMFKHEGRVSHIIDDLLPEFTLHSLLRIIRGPRFWVIHGRPLKFGTIALMRLLGKHVSVIHWGGRATPLPARKLGFIYRFAYTLLDKYYVLMTPEAAGFKKIIGRDIVSVLPYPMLLKQTDPTQYSQTIDVTAKTMILGNNGYSRDTYGEILDKIRPGSWDKIICMLNYGKEGDVEINESFIAKYTEKFGKAFFAWRETLPLAQYLEYVKTPMCYIGPQEMQSGLGAIFCAVMAGRAIFLRGDNYAWLKEIGIAVYHIDEIDDWSYENILKYVPSNSEYRKNCEAAINHYKTMSNEDYWKKTLIKDLVGKISDK